MTIIDSETGNELQRIPVLAKCTETYEYLEEMDFCPLRRFDAAGSICIPDYCTRYEDKERI